MARVSTTPLQRLALIAFAIVLAVVVVTLSVHFANSGRRKEEVSTVTGKPVSGVLNTTTPLNLAEGYSFDVNDNLLVCNRKLVRVPLNFSTTDYAPAINKAIADVERDGGGSVSLEQGVYTVSSPIFVLNHTCLRGQGMLKTMLVMNPGSPPFFRAGMVRIRQADRVSLFDFTLDGARAKQNNGSTAAYGRYGMFATEFNYLWIRGVRAVNHPEYGFDPHGTKLTWSNYLVIESCDASENGKDGFTIDQTNHVSLLRSTARHNYRHGVNIVTGSSNVLVSDVTADFNGASTPDSRGCGIIAQNNLPSLQTQNITIANSTVSESPRGGVCISDTIDVSVYNVNATVTRFLRTPCFVLRKARQVTFNNTFCTARSGIRLSNIQSMFLDDKQGQVSRYIPKNPLEFAKQPSLYSSVPENDPFCTYGISYENVCCPHDCDTCGGVGCGVFGQADRCCMNRILAQKEDCSNTTAPCVVKPRNLPLPDVFIDIPHALPPAGNESAPEPLAVPPGGLGKPISSVSTNRSNTTMPVNLPGPREAVPVSKDSGKRSNGTILVDISMNGTEAMPVSKDSGKNKTIVIDLTDENKTSEKDDAKDDSKDDGKKKKDAKDDEKKSEDDSKKKKEAVDKKVSRELPRMLPSTIDPKCDFGISYKNVCCPYECNVCGQKDCGKNGQAHYCCMDSINEKKASCSDTTAPCVVDPKYLPLPKGKNTTNEKILKKMQEEGVEEIIVDSEGNNELLSQLYNNTTSEPDPLCKAGTSFKNICCPKDCKVCGEKGCGKDGQGSRCCLDGITESKKSCSKHSAPCVFAKQKDDDADKKDGDKKENGEVKEKDDTEKKDDTAEKDDTEKKDDTVEKDNTEKKDDKQKVDSEKDDNEKKEGANKTEDVEGETKDGKKEEPKKKWTVVNNNANATKKTSDESGNMKDSDPTCKRGTRFKDVCCPFDCNGVCGNDGCGVDGQNERCCYEAISGAKKSCSVNTAPCVIGLKAEASNNNNTTKSSMKTKVGGDNKCEKGIVYKNVCCPKDCDVCSKAGCGKDGLAGRCCMDSIIDANKSCNNSESPCVIDEKYLPRPKGEMLTPAQERSIAQGNITVVKNITMVEEAKTNNSTVKEEETKTNNSTVKEEETKTNSTVKEEETKTNSTVKEEETKTTELAAMLDKIVKGLSEEEKKVEGKTVDIEVDSEGKMIGGTDVKTKSKEVYMDGKEEKEE